MTDKKKICIIGSGNTGSVLAKIAGTNCAKRESLQEEVTMYVYEETIDGKKLTDIINDTHENVKYLPGRKLPTNVVAVPDMEVAAKDADIIVFVVPHKNIRTVCATLFGKIKPSAVGLSLIKGYDKAESGGLELMSRIIGGHLRIHTYVLTGVNFAGELAEEKFCEIAIGCKMKKTHAILRDVFETDYLSVVLVDDLDTVEVCSTLSTVVACAAGFLDGLGQGLNSKAAVFRKGLLEMIKFVDLFYPTSKLSTFVESCSIADLLTACYSGRNRRFSEAFVRTGKSVKELEDELLNGQRFQGSHVAQEINFLLRHRDLENVFPMFTAVHKVFDGHVKPEAFLDCIRCHINVRLQHLAW